jgi:hypothetical protein
MTTIKFKDLSPNLRFGIIGGVIYLLFFIVSIFILTLVFIGVI